MTEKNVNVGGLCFSPSDLMISFSTLSTVRGDSIPHPPCIIQHHPSNPITSPTIQLLCNLVSSSPLSLHFLKTCKPCKKIIKYNFLECVVSNSIFSAHVYSMRYRKKNLGYPVHFGSVMYSMTIDATSLTICMLLE